MEINRVAFFAGEKVKRAQSCYTRWVIPTCLPAVVTPHMAILRSHFYPIFNVFFFFRVYNTSTYNKMSNNQFR